MDPESQNAISRGGKLTKIAGWFLVVVGATIFLVSSVTAINWYAKKHNYEQQYVDGPTRALSYRLDGHTINITKLLDTAGEDVSLELPEDQTAVVYCEKSNPASCIYFDMDNAMDENALNPSIGLYMSFMAVALGLYVVLTIKYADKDHASPRKPLFALFLVLFLAGISVVIYQVYLTVEHSVLKSQNNTTTARIYSSIYNASSSKNNMYKPVADYYVNGVRYVYVKDLYTEGSLAEDRHKTFELYYDKDNPRRVSEKEKPINLVMTFIGVAFIVLGAMGLFKKETAKR